MPPPRHRALTRHRTAALASALALGALAAGCASPEPAPPL
ncbi:VacJ family lipoprotein, partial [Streptomyces sp. SID8455]|nr:VacJ family lipoprotein [Streptomyces sp. SID8455]